MTAYEQMVIDLLIGMEVIEALRLLITLARVFRRDWRRKKKDE